MAKSKKKRNKPYRGQDAAASSQPVIHRYTAVERGRLGQWWFEKKRIIKPVALAAGIIVVVGWLIFEAVRIISG